MRIILDASKMTEAAAAHQYLMEQLPLPEHYGKNLDALYDCLGELEDTVVVFENIPEEPSYFYRVLRVFRDAACRSTGLQIEER